MIVNKHGVQDVDTPHANCGLPFCKSGFARWTCAAVLLLAAALKAYQQVANPALGVLYGSQWLHAALIEYEVILAFWLVSGIGCGWSRRIALATFGAFACYSFYLGYSGNSSCGCFGHVHVNPWLTFALDVALVALVGPCKTPAGGVNVSDDTAGTWPKPIMASLAILAGLMVIGVPILTVARWHSATAPDSISDQSVVVLEPEKWIQKRFPLIEYIDIGPRLASGSWTIVFYHYDCPKCQAAIAKYEQMAIDMEPSHPLQVAFVEVPPYDPGDQGSISQLCQHGRLSDTKEWFIKTPAEVRLQAGKVVAAQTSDDTFMAKTVEP